MLHETELRPWLVGAEKRRGMSALIPDNYLSSLVEGVETLSTIRWSLVQLIHSKSPRSLGRSH